MSSRVARSENRGAGLVRRRSSLAVVVPLFVAGAWIAACGSTEPELRLCTFAGTRAPTRILTEPGDTLTVTAFFTGIGNPLGGDPPTCRRPPGSVLIWRSSDTTVAVVEEDTTLALVDTTALVSARGEGTAFVSAQMVAPGESPPTCHDPVGQCGGPVIVDFPDAVSGER